MAGLYSKPLRVHFCGREECAPGHSFGPAVRSHYLMHVVLEGKGIYQAYGRTYHIGRGEAFLIHPEEVTFYKADEEQPWEYAWIAFDGYEAEALLGRTGFRDKNMVWGCGDSGQFIKQTIQLTGDFVHNRSNELELLGQFLKVMSFLYLEGTKKPEEGYDQRYFQKAFDYIRQNYGYPIQIQDVANFTGIDRTYLYKIFMNVVQCAPKQYLMQFRLKAAENMLESGRYSVTETAYSCGFRDTSSFSGYFKRAVGMTPTEYMAKWKYEAAYSPVL